MSYESDREEIYFRHLVRDAEASLERKQRDIEYSIKHPAKHEPVNYGDIKPGEALIVMAIVLLGFGHMLGLI